MKEKEISYDEMVEIFEDSYCNGNRVSIIGDYDFGSITTTTNRLEVYSDDNIVHMYDESDNELRINRCNVGRIVLSDNDIMKAVKMDLGNSRLTFILCN
jgi:hypothetical protein